MVAAPVNVVMSRPTVGTVSQMRFLTKEALKSGKIKLIATIEECPFSGIKMLLPYYNMFFYDSHNFHIFLCIYIIVFLNFLKIKTLICLYVIKLQVTVFDPVT